MIVEEIMRTNVITLKKEESIESAIKLLTKHHLRHVTVVDEDNYIVGIVSDKDIRDASPSVFSKDCDSEYLKISLDKIMTRNVTTVHPLDFVEEVSAIFYEKEIACLPVAKDGKLVGVITEKDMLYTLIQLTGANQPGTQIEVRVENKAGILAKVTSIIGRRNINIHSVLVYPDSKDSNFKILVFRIQTMNPMGIIQDLKNEGHTVLWPNLPGMNQ